MFGVLGLAQQDSSIAEGTEHRRLTKIQALAAFSPDAIASIGYADQEIYLGLVVAGAVGLAMALPIAMAITGLLAILALSYTQIIQKYPSGGGSYEVARKTLGPVPGLVAAAALVVNYLLNVAVSLTTGVDAIASAFPALWAHRVIISLLLLLGMTVLNLRGMRESGIVMAIPVYLFVFSYFGMMGYGGIDLAIGGHLYTPVPPPAPVQPLTLALLLHTFSTGCTAMTGVEAISNGVPSFRAPETRNASQTMVVMALLMGILFLGSIGLIQTLSVVAGPQETVLSALAHRLLGTGPAYLIIQAGTLIMLTVGANTSFAGLPRLMSVMSKDGYLPERLARMNSRQVFANGIILLGAASAVLIVGFSGSSHALVPLFAIGVFLAWTLSQSGMVIHWRRERGSAWRLKALLNGTGAVATAVTFVIVGSFKFTEGGWIALFLIPLLVILFIRCYKYRQESQVVIPGVRS
ncbi:MAG TPA: APC family permease [Terriglobales bacterium]|nr:APC family permease [Terriglobales bacterium]